MIVQMVTILALAACVASNNRPVVWRAEGSNCASVLGGTRLIVHGERFNRSEALAVTVIHWPENGDGWERVDCVVIDRDEGHATCLTVAVRRPSSVTRQGTVVVAFDVNRWTVPDFRFRYVAHPEIEANQTLRGNGTAGARVLVRLVRPLQCAHDVTLYAARKYEPQVQQHNDDSSDHCVVHGFDATTLDCPAPVVRTADDPTVNDDFFCGLHMRLAGEPTDVPCDPSTVYVVRHPPSFRYFVTDPAGDRRLYVFAPHLKWRVRAPDGVSVWFALAGERLPCPVDGIEGDLLACVPPAHVDYDGIREVTVSLNGLEHLVPRRLSPDNNN